MRTAISLIRDTATRKDDEDEMLGFEKIHISLDIQSAKNRSMGYQRTDLATWHSSEHHKTGGVVTARQRATFEPGLRSACGIEASR